MRRVILDLAVTLDGFIEGKNGEIDWCIMNDDMDFTGFLSSIDTILYGRVSYDSWGNYQPGPAADDAEKKFWADIHDKKKYVFSSRPATDPRATFIQKDIAASVAVIKQQAEKDIWLYGGASLTKTFIDLGLIDVYRLSVHPVVLGSGKPLFEALNNRISLQLLSNKVFRSGVVQLIYAPKNK